MTEMLQKSENVAKNVANKNSQDLTEQLKKGELLSGWYYLKVNEELANCPVIAECIDDFNLGLPLSYFYDFDVAKIEQVLAPVPTFDEWQAKLEENAQLKELLKEVKDYLPEFETPMNILAKIDEVLK